MLFLFGRRPPTEPLRISEPVFVPDLKLGPLQDIFDGEAVARGLVGVQREMAVVWLVRLDDERYSAAGQPYADADELVLAPPELDDRLGDLDPQDFVEARSESCCGCPARNVIVASRIFISGFPGHAQDVEGLGLHFPLL